MTYGDIVTKFFFEALPTMQVAPAVRFEAISAAVFGTKQLRYGPLPPPEVQVTVREALRRDGPVLFFVPWGVAKQEPGAKLDVLEFMALRQLRCVRDTLARYGVESRFVFRLDDNSDRWNLGEDRGGDIDEYADDFRLLILEVLGTDGLARRESQLAGYADFRATAERLTPVFFKVITKAADPSALAEIGWKGGLPQEQLDYYYAAYRQFYPGQDHQYIAAKYFASALTRHKLGATAVPTGPHVAVSFFRPVPGHPLAGNRVYYRTLPERYTHQHKAPWGGRGYLEVSADGACAPKYVEKEVAGRLTDHAVQIGGVTVAAPYLEV